MRGRGLSLASLTLVVALAAPGLAQTISLDVEPGAAPGEVLLSWTGGEPTFEVFRSSEPQAVEDPGNEIGETLVRSFADTPPAGNLFFFKIGTRAPTVPETITIELTRPNDDPIGRPLPIAAHWNTGRPSSGQPGWDPDFMMDFLDAGEYVIPAFKIQMPTWTQEPWVHFQSGLQRARAAGIPIAIRFTQWDRPFSDDPDYFDLPPADNPNVIDAADGVTIVPKTDPEGPIARWQELGAEWGSMPIVADIEAEYPDPPLVIWLNNFEHPRLEPPDVDTSWRFVQNHGTNKTDDEKRQIIGDGWIARDGALFAALRDRLTPAWQTVSIPVCYSAFGRRKYGAWNGWDARSLHVPNRFSPWPSVVNGSPSYYVLEDPEVHTDTDYRAAGPQMSAMNWAFMLDEAYRDSPGYFWEVSAYDGGIQRQAWYAQQGQIYDKARYKGFIRYGLWLTRPRILREFRLASQDRSLYLQYWDAVMEAVKEVHDDPDLRRFWRAAEPVVNTTFPHYYQKNLYPGYTDADVDRNFMLEASANPPRPWNNLTTIEVWALALVLGETPNREWLLFAYAPLQAHAGVTIAVPGYGDVTLDLPRGNGAFRILAE